MRRGTKRLKHLLRFAILNTPFEWNSKLRNHSTPGFTYDHWWDSLEMSWLNAPSWNSNNFLGKLPESLIHCIFTSYGIPNTVSSGDISLRNFDSPYCTLGILKYRNLIPLGFNIIVLYNIQYIMLYSIWYTFHRFSAQQGVYAYKIQL